MAISFRMLWSSIHVGSLRGSNKREMTRNPRQNHKGTIFRNRKITHAMLVSVMAITINGLLNLCIIRGVSYTEGDALGTLVCPRANYIFIQN